MALGRLFVRDYSSYRESMIRIDMGEERLTADHLFPPPSAVIFASLRDSFRGVGISDSDLEVKIIEYLTSPALKNIPTRSLNGMISVLTILLDGTGEMKMPWPQPFKPMLRIGRLPSGKAWQKN